MEEDGLRLHGHGKFSTEEYPLVTVITVVYNDSQGLLATIPSVCQQSYPNLEYIVIDGGSTDGTVEILKANTHKIDYWCSEPDDGIYNAMNKGIAKAQGEWINFMNAGDRFFSLNTVANMMREIPPGTELAYGNCQVDYHGFSKFRKATSVSSLWRGMPFVHQALFARLFLHRQFKFNEKIALASDFEFIFKCYSQGHCFYQSQETVAIYLAGGISDIKRIKVIQSHYQVVRQYHKSWRIRLYYTVQILDAFIRLALKQALPPSIVSWIIRSK